MLGRLHSNEPCDEEVALAPGPKRVMWGTRVGAIRVSGRGGGGPSCTAWSVSVAFTILAGPVVLLLPKHKGSLEAWLLGLLF